MKSYTNIEQSKKLAKILPIESADMTWEQVTKDLAEDFTWKPTIGLNEGIKGNLFSYRNGYISPCWSLTALLDIIPNNQGRYTKSLYWFDDAWHCEYVDEDGVGILGTSADNAIDACYELVLKLRERKVL